MLVAIVRRIQRKLAALAPIVAGALLLVGALALVAVAAEPYLPAAYRQLLHDLRAADWTTVRAQLQSLVAAHGGSGAALFVALQTAQVLIAPVPGQLLGLLGGAMFGFWPGLLLSMLGLALGSVVAMGGSRLVGDRLVRRFVPHAILDRFDDLIRADGVWSFFIMFLLPVFPDDALCFMAGLTRLPLRRLLLVCLIGRIPGSAVLSFVGANIDRSSQQAYLVLGVGLVLALIVWLWSDEVVAVAARLRPNTATKTRERDGRLRYPIERVSERRIQRSER